MDETKTFQVIFYNNSSFFLCSEHWTVLVCRWLAWIPTLYFVSLVACSFLDISLMISLYCFLSLAFVAFPLPAKFGISQTVVGRYGAYSFHGFLFPRDFPEFSSCSDRCWLYILNISSLSSFSFLSLKLSTVVECTWFKKPSDP